MIIGLLLAYSTRQQEIILEKARGALETCLTQKADPCQGEKNAYEEALRALESVAIDRTQELEGTTRRIGSYTSCKHARRWWQFWKSSG